MRTFKTPKGSELPLLNLRGKEYLEVKFRLVWFREDHPDWRIQTEIISHDKDNSLVCAKIFDSSGNLMSMAHKTEDRKDFPDHLEKCETSAIGRALALVGYGTQFCADELDEGERIVDSPVEPKIPPSLIETPKVSSSAIQKAAEPIGGEYVCTFGKKFKGMKLKDIMPFELESYLEWLEDSARKKGMPLSSEVMELKRNAEAVLKKKTSERDTPVSLIGKTGESPFAEMTDAEEEEVERMMRESQATRYFFDDPNPTTIGERMNRK